MHGKRANFKIKIKIKKRAQKKEHYRRDLNEKKGKKIKAQEKEHYRRDFNEKKKGKKNIKKKKKLRSKSDYLKNYCKFIKFRYSKVDLIK